MGLLFDTEKISEMDWLSHGLHENVFPLAVLNNLGEAGLIIVGGSVRIWEEGAVLFCLTVAPVECVPGTCSSWCRGSVTKLFGFNTNYN
jgi:hypothetical protein